ncbi:hypothetical protein CEUSTIGMA_g5227.t1 [Chlamydomonas eustigma]|uniref:Photosystem I reaction center subunit III n=1 Tax=Chlamydomonas eustigma TaxID=1157962 RepID=A0A250X3X8_9CHLO|nr:hypothetical protein CEUSTIGMA_g5227.t1 [Chlamydomonas eustigma]|eukprot:GAX77784.1 hypothetical protein CEUSTIGMA_g5227.t1 [Chlamydomonas eustigma]
MALRTSSQVSSRSAVRSTAARRSVVVRASQQKPSTSVAPAVAAAALAAIVGFGSVDAAYADIAGLTPCSKSKAYDKRLKNELKTLNRRKKQYEAGSAPALALDATIERTKTRFVNYAKSGVLCGNDGLPHLIADPGLALKFGHAGEIFIPTFGFLYIAGWIGYVGREYLNIVKKEKSPTEKEIIIDVPLALNVAGKGAGWPIRVIAELQADTLTEKPENITVSPR